MIRSCLVSLTIILAMAVSPNTGTAQDNADSLAAQVDQLFAQWDKPDSPGCTCAVMRDGEVVYSRAVGMANLELGVPLTTQSVFIVGSVSKQFTAASIALLALRGQLSLDDDIRTYVPEIPDLGETMTVRHFVHHTSGLRADDLRHFSGSWGRDYYSNDRLLAMMARQRTLNFRPGEQHIYLGFGYVVLAEVVKRVSGQSLREFAEENIFGPLGMANTQFDDDHTRIVKNRVQSYGDWPDGFHRLLRNTDHVGSGGLLSTAEDLLRWNRNFDDMTVGGPDFIELILTRGTLNNGDSLNYAFGLRHAEYRGLRMVGHGGGWKGFRAVLMRFPEQQFAVAVLCNLQPRNFTLALRVADIYLRGSFQVVTTANESRPMPVAVAVPTSELENVTGYYWDDTGLVLRRIYVRDDTLRYSSGTERTLVPLGDDRFSMLATSRERIVSFPLPAAGQPRQMVVVDNGTPDSPCTSGCVRISHAVEPVSPSLALDGYLGTYYSQDADYEWELRITNDTLSMWDPRTWVELALTPFATDMFRYQRWMYFTFTRDGQGRVVGFTVDTERLRNLKFVRR